MVVDIPIENGRQVGILVVSSISIAIATIFVGLRIVAKSISNRFDYSDYCIIAALIWNVALHACCMTLVTHGGFGFHTAEIYQRFGPETAIFFFKGIMAFAMLWNVVVCFSKLSILLMYTALIPIPSMIKWCRWIGATIIAWNIADIIAAFLICRPLARNWNFFIPGTCGSQPAFYFAMGFVNLVTDAVIIVLPMPYLYRLNLEWRKKLLSMALLSIGIGTWAITIYRQILLPSLDFNDMTHSGVLATILSGLEPAVAIVLACIPLLRPLFGGKSRHDDLPYNKYGSGKRASLFSKKGSSGSHGHDPTATFSELVDDNDTSSEIRLQPIKPVQMVRVSSSDDRPKDLFPSTTDNYTITVEKKWEVRRD
ncbi:hypothetical protein BDW02DRAFT_490820 [Decorospora gaudefroyi]|uniref:Rhodopsin domain-containing protein n=1 Tax=Decorospora gaudefroyi TaxID=184978 RepID=A0A6A5KRN2_9PLEO|nr:hypothetical protein BDW02DRAFT_490820 [Decorospora gaudefroyi]